MRERQYFPFGDIADALAKDPESLEIDAAKRDRIASDLSDWTIRGEFDLSGDSEVVFLTGEPPFFLPLGPVPPGGILADPEGLLLRREACGRYLRKSSLQQAPRLLSDWFPETAVEPQSPAREATFPNPGQPDSGRRGAYRGALDSWMAKQKLSILQKMEPAGIAREFKAYCDRALPGLIPLLPKRLRSMESVIERIIARRVGVARAESSSSKHDRKRQ